MAVNGSSDYIWYEDEKLGSGAFGNVYIARARKSGAKLAVKVFKPQARPEYVKLREREVSIVGSLRHDNIVKVLAIQQEKLSKNTVLVMELCEGGSLQTVLEKPDNMYGLTETYFLLLLSHLEFGLKYLHQQRVGLRDITPSNVLIYIQEDKSHVFKLTDFHQLGDEADNFVSMFGTEECLTLDIDRGPHFTGGRNTTANPANPPEENQKLTVIFGTDQEALTRGQRVARGQTTGGAAPRQMFNASTALWSLAITLYQSATGILPFRTLNGRPDRHTMLTMATGKGRGVISAVEQLTGIHYDNKLPTTCQFSRGLKGLLTPLLAGLLESKKQYQFNTNEFFERAEDISSRKVLYAFCVSTCEHIRLYVKAENTLFGVQDLLAHATDIPARDQELYLNQTPLHHHVTSDTDVTHYPQTSEDAPIIVLPGPARFLAEKFRPCQSELPKIPNQDSSSLISDAKWAKESTAFICYASMRVLKMRLTGTLLSMALQTVRVEILNSRDITKRVASDIKVIFKELEDLVCAWTRASVTLNLGHRNRLGRDEEKINKQLTRLRQEEVRYSSEWEKTLAETDSFLHSDNTTLPQISPQKAQRSVELSEQSLHHLQADRAAGSLSHNQQQLHRFEKAQLAKQTEKTIGYFNSCTGQMTDHFCNVIRQMRKACSQRVAVNKTAAYFESLRLESCGLMHTLSSAMLKIGSKYRSISIPADSGYGQKSGSSRVDCRSCSTVKSATQQDVFGSTDGVSESSASATTEQSTTSNDVRPKMSKKRLNLKRSFTVQAETDVADANIPSSSCYPPMRHGSNDSNPSAHRTGSNYAGSQGTSGYTRGTERGDVEAHRLSYLNDTLRQHGLRQTETDMVQAARGDTKAQLHQLVESLSDEETNRRLLELLIELLQTSQDVVHSMLSAGYNAGYICEIA